MRLEVGLVRWSGLLLGGAIVTACAPNPCHGVVSEAELEDLTGASLQRIVDHQGDLRCESAFAEAPIANMVVSVELSRRSRVFEDWVDELALLEYPEIEMHGVGHVFARASSIESAGDRSEASLEARVHEALYRMEDSAPEGGIEPPIFHVLMLDGERGALRVRARASRVQPAALRGRADSWSRRLDGSARY